MKKILLFLCLVPMVCLAQPGTINTIAGNGYWGYTGDGGPATAASLNRWTSSVTCDVAGNIYIADNYNNCIRLVNTSGIISTIAGNGSASYTGDGGLATAATLHGPTGIVLDGSGNIFVSDRYNNCIRKIDASGIITTVVGNGTPSFSGDGGPATAAGIDQPDGITLDNAGNLYIADWYNYRVRKVNTSGIITTFAGMGAFGYSGDGGPATDATFEYISALATDISGNVYVTDGSSNVVRMIAPSGIITTVAGNGAGGYSGDGGPATAAALSSVRGITINSAGELFIADRGNYCIRKVNAVGIISTIAGSGGSVGYGGDGGPATAALFNAPNALVLDSRGDLYICDGDVNSRIRKVQYAPDFVSDSFSIFINKYCSGPQIRIVPNHYSAGMYVKTHFGDSNSDSSSVLSSGAAVIMHSYASNGTYTIKHLLYSGSIILDSFQYSYTHTLCNAFPVNFYYDANSNCTKDTADVMLGQPLTIEVDSNGVAIDTLSATSGLYYTAYGSVGDVYAFRIISMPPAFHVTCPSTGILYDTITIGTSAVAAKSMGFECSTSSAFDLGIVSTAVRTGVHAHTGNIYASNAYCPPVNATVTLRHSPKHTYHYADPAPASTTATSVTWNLSALTSVNGAPTSLYYHLETPSSAYLTPGDTVNSNIVITPDSADADTSNNVIVIVDTVRAGYDPNAIYVKPAGCIASGTLPTQLEYTITFENTGNDTAHNIYVMDTLPDYVDVSTMRIVMASHEMYTSKIKDAAGHNILKFDFPVINLLDSSHHGLCDGAVIYDIKTKPGLAIGTNIMNRVGIYFDVNPVVMTNEAITAIGCPIVNEVAPLSPKGELSLYPNPANDVLNIKQADNSYTSFTITNNIGGVIMSGSLNKTLTQLNIQSLPPGLYFINLKGEQGSVVKKVVKW